MMVSDVSGKLHFVFLECQDGYSRSVVYIKE